MTSVDLGLLLGWTVSLVICALAIWRRNLWLAFATVLALSCALTALALHEHRQSLAVGAREYDEDSGRYATLALARRMQASGRPVPRSVKVETYARGLTFPVSMAWDEGSDIVYVTERNGDIRVLENGRLIAEPCASVPASHIGENDGLLGIALSPNFEADRFLYVYYTDANADDNRVVRFSVTKDHKCIDPLVVIEELPMSVDKFMRHNGGQLEFLGSTLLVSVGEGEDASRSQDPDSYGGKILRLTPDGSIPSDNPDPDSAVWAYGFRNPFGLATGPRDVVYATDNGPFCTDELDLVRPGRNYGWGAGFEVENCREGLGANPTAPLHTWDTTVAPTDAFYYTGPLRELRGLLVGDFNFGFLHRFKISTDGTTVESETRYRLSPGLRILDVSEGPGGWIYVVGTRPRGGFPGEILRLTSK